MQILIFVLSALAAIFAGAALVLVIQERRHNQDFAAAVDLRFKGMAKANKESKAAMLKYVDESDRQAAAAAEKFQKESADVIRKEVNARIEKISGVIRAVNMKADSAKKQAKVNAERIEDLEHGVVPDYEAARKAADEFNKFNEGIAGILGFDPLEAMKKSRQEDE